MDRTARSDCPAFDVVVAGAGPAGSVTALCLARLGWNVGLLEKVADAKRYGETLPPECNPLLRGLGLWDAFQRSKPLQAPGIVSSWGHPGRAEQDFLSNRHGSGWHVDRTRFDAELCVEAARSGVTVLPVDSVRTCVRQDGWWRLGGVRASLVVDASGRGGLPINGTTDRELEDRLLVQVLRIEHGNARPSDLRTIIASVPHGWWYWTPVPDGTSVAMFFTGQEEYQDVRALGPAGCASEAADISARISSGDIVDSQWTYASSSIRRTICGDHWIAVGDSASSYDPLSGRGIFKAIWHASIAAPAIDAAQRGHVEPLADYETRVRREYRDYVRQRRSYYSQERRWLLSPFWARRAS